MRKIFNNIFYRYFIWSLFFIPVFLIGVSGQTIINEAARESLEIRQHYDESIIMWFTIIAGNVSAPPSLISFFSSLLVISCIFTLPFLFRRSLLVVLVFSFPFLLPALGCILGIGKGSTSFLCSGGPMGMLPHPPLGLTFLGVSMIVLYAIRVIAFRKGRINLFAVILRKINIASDFAPSIITSLWRVSALIIINILVIFLGYFFFWDFRNPKSVATAFVEPLSSVANECQEKFYYEFKTVLNMEKPETVCAIRDTMGTGSAPREGLKVIPKEIVRYSNLRELEIDSDLITEIPPYIKENKKLTKLWVGGDKLSIVPKEIGRLIFLRELHLGNNIKELPAEIGNLKQLDWLVLSNNQIKVLPVEIGKLNELTKLNLQNNNITYLPKEIGKLESLLDLKINGNPISDLPVQISNLTNLKRICIADTNLSEEKVKELLPGVYIDTSEECGYMNLYD